VKKKEFKFTPQVFFRLVLFIIIIVISFSYLSQGQMPNVLGDFTVQPYLDTVYQQLPPSSRDFIENYSTNSTVIEINKQIENLKSQTQDFPNRQIKEIQKEIVRSLSDKLIQIIDNNK